MGGGSVLDFTNRSFNEFFKDFGIEIYNDRYLAHENGNSKANRMRAFWAIESNELVSQVLHSLLGLVESGAAPCDIKKMENVRKIANELIGDSTTNRPIKDNSDIVNFLKKSFENDCIESNLLSSDMAAIINRRLDEVNVCLSGKAYLSAVIMAGSLLEGLLLELARINIKIFNESSGSPKDRNGKVKKLCEWTLAQLIEVSYETKFIGEDVKKYSTALRDFRNYIHPQEQLKYKFHPDEHTAVIAMQVLKATIADISNQRLSTKL